MKRYAAVLAVLLLAGCAASNTGLREQDLRKPQYERGEYSIPLMFAPLQMALFKHEDTCGHAPQFRMDERETHYAMLIDLPAGSNDLRDAIIVDLTQYPPNYWHEGRSSAMVYSYRTDAETRARIAHMLDIFSHPEQCP